MTVYPIQFCIVIPKISQSHISLETLLIWYLINKSLSLLFFLLSLNNTNIKIYHLDKLQTQLTKNHLKLVVNKVLPCRGTPLDLSNYFLSRRFYIVNYAAFRIFFIALNSSHLTLLIVSVPSRCFDIHRSTTLRETQSDESMKSSMKDFINTTVE